MLWFVRRLSGARCRAGQEVTLGRNGSGRGFTALEMKLTISTGDQHYSDRQPTVAY